MFSAVEGPLVGPSTAFQAFFAVEGPVSGPSTALLSRARAKEGLRAVASGVPGGVIWMISSNGRPSPVDQKQTTSEREPERGELAVQPAMRGSERTNR